MTDPNIPNTPATPDEEPAQPLSPPSVPPPIPPGAGAPTPPQAGGWPAPPPGYTQRVPPPRAVPPQPPPAYGGYPPPYQVPPGYGYGMGPQLPPPGFSPPPRRRNRVLPVIIGLSIFAVVAIIGLAGIVSSLSMGGTTTSATTGGGLGFFGGKIGVLYIEGVLGEGPEYGANTRVLVDQVRAWQKNDRIKAIVLRINSPGGAVSATQDLYAALNEFRTGTEKSAGRPVYASMGDVAASGGYYTALAADEVYANEGTITGSIGVIMSFYDYQGLQRKVGLRSRNVKSGEFKDLGSGSRAMTVDEKELLNTMITDVYEQFLDAVVAGRGSRIKTMIVPTAPETVKDETVRERVRQYADGRVFSGRQAVEYGMIDGIMTLDEVISYAAQKAGLNAEEPSVVRAPIKPQGLFGSLDNIATKMDKTDFGMKEGVKFEYRFGVD